MTQPLDAVTQIPALLPFLPDVADPGRFSDMLETWQNRPNMAGCPRGVEVTDVLLAAAVGAAGRNNTSYHERTRKMAAKKTTRKKAATTKKTAAKPAAGKTTAAKKAAPK